MSIRILKNENKIVLKTKSTTYAMEILHGKFPVHLYYGKSSPNLSLTFESRHRAFSPNYPEYGRNFAPDNEMMEFPFFGYGDFRTTALRVRDLETGSDITDYVFRKAKKFTGRKEIPGIPCGDADEKTETLELIRQGKLDTVPLITHTYALKDIEAAYDLFENRRDGVIKVAIEMK